MLPCLFSQAVRNRFHYYAELKIDFALHDDSALAPTCKPGPPASEQYVRIFVFNTCDLVSVTSWSASTSHRAVALIHDVATGSNVDLEDLFSDLHADGVAP